MTPIHGCRNGHVFHLVMVLSMNKVDWRDIVTKQKGKKGRLFDSTSDVYNNISISNKKKETREGNTSKVEDQDLAIN